MEYRYTILIKGKETDKAKQQLENIKRIIQNMGLEVQDNKTWIDFYATPKQALSVHNIMAMSKMDKIDLTFSMLICNEGIFPITRNTNKQAKP
jgi:hypothetical protein